MNDLERNKLGRLQLPNLVAGNAIEVVVKLQVPAQAVESDVCFVRLAWSAPDSTQRFVVREALSLPSVSSGEWDALPENERVADAVALLETARIRQQAVEELERGDVVAAAWPEVSKMAQRRRKKPLCLNRLIAISTKANTRTWRNWPKRTTTSAAAARAIEVQISRAFKMRTIDGLLNQRTLSVSDG